jgi:hemoglobin
MKALLLICLAFVVGCTTHTRPEPKLYDQLGGIEGITEVVDALLYEIAEDKAILPLFSNTDIARFRSQLIDQLCSIADGPCKYKGDNMRETHRGLDLTRAHFNRLVENLIAAMDSRGVAVSTQNALLARLAPLYPEVMNL